MEVVPSEIRNLKDSSNFAKPHHSGQCEHIVLQEDSSTFAKPGEEGSSNFAKPHHSGHEHILVLQEDSSTFAKPGEEGSSNFAKPHHNVVNTFLFIKKIPAILLSQEKITAIFSVSSVI